MILPLGPMVPTAPPGMDMGEVGEAIGLLAGGVTAGGVSGVLGGFVAAGGVDGIAGGLTDAGGADGTEGVEIGIEGVEIGIGLVGVGILGSVPMAAGCPEGDTGVLGGIAGARGAPAPITPAPAPMPTPEAPALAVSPEDPVGDETSPAPLLRRFFGSESGRGASAGEFLGTSGE